MSTYFHRADWKASWFTPRFLSFPYLAAHLSSPLVKEMAQCVVAVRTYFQTIVQPATYLQFTVAL